MKTTIDLQEKLITANRRVLEQENAVIKHQAALDAEADKLVSAVLDRATATYEADKLTMLRSLGFDLKVQEAEAVTRRRSAWGHLPQERIFSRDAIRDLCLTYNLRFLSTSHYKGALDSAVPGKVEELKVANGGTLPSMGRETWGILMSAPLFLSGSGEWTPVPDSSAANQRFNQNVLMNNEMNTPPPAPPAHPRFFIAAPAESFALQPRPIDPLLFCQLGDDLFYLVHKWGNDISVFRRLTKWLLVGWGFWARAGGSTLAAATAISWVWSLSNASTRQDAAYTLTVIAVVLASLAVFVPGVPFRKTTRSNWNSPYRD